MNNSKVCEYIKNIDLYNNGEIYISELCGNEGYGQSCGGFLESNKENSTQQDHFVYYYGGIDKIEKNPTYSYLRCPQLMVFIAEAAGVSKKIGRRIQNFARI